MTASGSQQQRITRRSWHPFHKSNSLRSVRLDGARDCAVEAIVQQCVIDQPTRLT